MQYYPEGCLFNTAENQRLISSAEGLKEAMSGNIILEARAAVCTSSHDLMIDLTWTKAIIHREDGALGIAEGKVKDIALISRVNKIVCFKVIDIAEDKNNGFSVVLSRAAAQKECMERYISALSPGDIISAKVTHLEQFGCFVDIGCGIPSMIPIDAISVSRISHPSDRFTAGQFIKAVVRSVENDRIFLSHKELLGTWLENASCFCAGETVSGIVRSVEEYGIFVELKPNLAGLAELRNDVRPGDRVSVYIKALIPEKMKIKLVIVDICDDVDSSESFDYSISSGHLDHWDYAPEVCQRRIVTDFV